MKLTALLLVPAILTGAASTASAVDYARQVPTRSPAWGAAHTPGGRSRRGDSPTTRLEDMQKQVKGGEPQKSSLLICITLPEDDEDVMPPKGKGKVTPQEVATIRQWIQEGANFTAGATPPAPAAAPAAPGAPAAGAPQKWKNTAGAEIEATFEGMDGTDFVLLKVVSTGVVHKVPLASLSPESQTLAKNGGK